uniref:Uncharacterized protein LOC114349524 n=1 Tax=Diabrotica virgifera virgifera TaxID=50390 RepID=A0A6P7H2R9_DIAVI
MKRLIVATIVFFAIYQAVDGIICKCDRYKCEENLVCKDSEILVKQGSLCGCCDDCYKKLYEGDNCSWATYSSNEDSTNKGSPRHLGPHEPLKIKCVDGLICNGEGKCAKVYQ